MALDTLANAQAELALFDAAIAAVSTGQSYTIGGRTLTRAELPQLQASRAIAYRAVEAHTDAARATPNRAPGFSVATWGATVS